MRYQRGASARFPICMVKFVALLALVAWLPRDASAIHANVRHMSTVAFHLPPQTRKRGSVTQRLLLSSVARRMFRVSATPALIDLLVWLGLTSAQANQSWFWPLANISWRLAGFRLLADRRFLARNTHTARRSLKRRQPGHKTGGSALTAGCCARPSRRFALNNPTAACSSQ